MDPKIIKLVQTDYILTCIGPKISPQFLEKLTALLLEKKITICGSRTVAEITIDCIAFSLMSEATVPPTYLVEILASLREIFGVDLVLQDADDYASQKKLVVMDLDSTLVQAEGIDELAKEAGVGEKVAQITQRAMNGEMVFSDALRERVHLLKGLPVEILQKVYERIIFTPGAIEFISTLRKKNYKTALLSGGFDCFANRYKENLNLDYAFSNRLEIKNNRLTGEVLGEIVDGQKKAFYMEEIARAEGIELNQIVAIGDGANDLPMIKKAGLGIAFNAKPAVRVAAPHMITQRSLTGILYLLGIAEDEI